MGEHGGSSVRPGKPPQKFDLRAGSEPGSGGQNGQRGPGKTASSALSHIGWFSMRLNGLGWDWRNLARGLRCGPFARFLPVLCVALALLCVCVKASSATVIFLRSAISSFFPMGVQAVRSPVNSACGLYCSVSLAAREV